MSNESRRRAERSRRLSMAAGALLAGAAIPIAAAGSAWADQTSDGNNAPGVPVATAGPVSVDVAGTGVHPNTSPDLTLTATQLETNYGLSTTEATAVSNAEFGNPADSVAPSAVEVSVDGKVIVDANQVAGASNEAIATSGVKTTDISIAIGGGSDSSASGNGALAFADGSSADANSDKATAKGTDANATINAGGTDATGADAKDVVTASGTDASASITDAGGSKTTASGFDASATINASGADANGVDQNDVVTAAGNYSTASIADTGDSKATASGFGATATIDANGADPGGLTNGKDVATAVGTHSAAIVQDSDGTTASAAGTSSYAEAGSDNNSITYVKVGTPDLAAASGDNDVTVKATGANADAEVDASTNITATASGTNTNVRADDDVSSLGKLTAAGTGAAVEASDDTGTVTVTARGTDSYAWVDGSMDSSATSTNDPGRELAVARAGYGLGPAVETGYAGVFDGTDSKASATGAGSTAVINPDEPDDQTVTGGTATATNGGYAAVENDGATLTSPVTAVAGDTAVASGPGSSADVVDSQTSALTVNNGQSYEFYGVAGQTETNQSLGTPPAETAPAPSPEVRLEPSIALP